MNNLFRQPNAGLSGYASLTIFAIVYLAAVALIVAPDHLLSTPASSDAEIQP